MEIYLYGTMREVLLAKGLLQTVFPALKEAQPIMDLPETSKALDQEHCRIYVCGNLEGTQNG